MSRYVHEPVPKALDGRHGVVGLHQVDDGVHRRAKQATQTTVHDVKMAAAAAAQTTVDDVEQAAAAAVADHRTDR